MRDKHYSNAIIIAMFSLFMSGFTRLSAQIAPSYDAYADSIVTSSALTGGLLQNAQNAVGAPDNNTVELAGINSSITLDMGEGEEGTGNLRLHRGVIEAAVNLKVDFLDSNTAVIKSDEQLLSIDLGNVSEYKYNYNDHSKAYRYVRITNLANTGFNLDAIESTDYIGMTTSTDTDNGGVADRDENASGMNPQDPSDDNIATTAPSGTPPSGSENTQTIDTDNDGMPDSWETDNGLNPNINDADEDPDRDGITNLFEYKKGGNPQSPNDFVLGSCTEANNAESKANLFTILSVLLFLLLLASLGGMFYYRNKYINRNKTAISNP